MKPLIMQNLLNRQPKDKLCLICGDRRLSYGRLDNESDLLAKKLPVQKGDLVLLRLPDPVEQLLYFFAVIKAGGVCVFADPGLSGKYFQSLSLEYGFKYDIAAQLPDDAPLLRQSLPDNSPGDIFLGVFTSGTTGAPKIIWRDQASWLAAFYEQGPLFGVDGDSVLYLTGALSYTGNLNAAMHAFFLGAAVVKAAGRLPRGWLAEIKKHRVNYLFMVPANLELLLRAMTGPDLNMRAVLSGGAKMNKATAEKLLDNFPKARIGEYYGSSELGHVSYITATELLTRPHSVGRLFPGVSVCIKDGVIWAKSPYIIPAARPKGTSGDLGALDADGYLSVYGRASGIINIAGVKVAPETIETALKSCPGIREAAAAGIADPLKGQKICAFIVKQDKSLTAADIIRFCRTRLNPNSCPQKIVFLPKLPLNNNGKVDYRLLKESLSDEY